MNAPSSLKRLLGMPTMMAVGIGVAIGSGIFRAPGEVARTLSSPTWILAAWLVAGLITLLQSLVSAELATRLPHAGGEYQFLKAAYGEFAAFLFGWCCTIFIVGGGAGAIAAALGDFAAELFESPGRGPLFGSAAIAIVVVVNCLGLRSGAAAQNGLTLLKVVVLAVIAGGAVWYAGRLTPAAVEPPAAEMQGTTIWAFLAAVLPAYWCYTGATDSVRLAEEVHDAPRALPRALIGTCLLLTIVYMSYNYGLLCAAAPSAMADRADAHVLAFADAGLPIREWVLAASVVICFGSISSSFLAGSRVVFAMARDGLAFDALARMTHRQAPVPALLLIGGTAIAFTWNRSFRELLDIYFLGSAILFGLVYVSLIVLRRKEPRASRETMYRLPLAPLWVGLLLVFEGSVAIGIVRRSPADSLGTLGIFAIVAIAYGIVRTIRRPA